MYDNGQGVPQGYKEALKWWRLAAEQEVAEAQVNLGLMYAKGQGVPQDYKEAVKWYRLAAEQENVDAQFNFGFMYIEGEGVPQDYVIAHMWWNVAGSNGKERASKNRKQVETEMSPSQVEKAQEMARNWKPTTK
jgi:hypothetical protein